MRFTTEADANGTCLKSTIEADYDWLVSIFGEPEDGDGEKTEVEWALEFEDGTIATIYDWKQYQKPVHTKIWHIGGHSNKAVHRVEETIAQWRLENGMHDKLKEEDYIPREEDLLKRGMRETHTPEQSTYTISFTATVVSTNEIDAIDQASEAILQGDYELTVKEES